jgi:hypothetical protein
MPSLPPIDATTPTTIPAVPAKVYDRWLATDIHITTTDINGPYSVAANMARARLLPDGVTFELSPVDPQVTLSVPDVTTAAQTDANLAQAMFYINASLISQGQSQGKL